MSLLIFRNPVGNHPKLSTDCQIERHVMSMSLVGDYADSESDEESGEDPEEEQVEEVPKAAKPTVRSYNTTLSL